MRFVVPVQKGSAFYIVLIIEGCPIVIVEQEGAVSARIDGYGGGFAELLSGILAHWIERHDRARAHVDGHGGEVYGPFDPASAGGFLARPPIEPIASRQIKPARSGALFDDWGDEQVASPKIFVP